MTFLELCEYTMERHNRYPVVIDSVDLGKSGGEFVITDPTIRQVIRAVQDAYNFLLGLSSHWSFLRVRGKLLDLTVGTESYTPSYDTPVWDSLHIRDGASRIPVFQMLYEDWLGLQATQVTPSGTPIYLVIPAPQEWIIWPAPLTNCELWGEASVIWTPLADEGDEPLWDEKLHWVVGEVAEALIEMRLDSTEEAVQKLNVAASSLAALQGVKQMLRMYGGEFEFCVG